MKIGQLQVAVKTKPHSQAKSRKAHILKDTCVLKHHCSEGGKILPGQLHAIMVWAARDGRRWYKRMHLNCLPAWLQYSYQTRLKDRGGNHGGRRPKGSGPLSSLDPDQLQLRNRLVRKRARLMRKFIEVWEPNKCQALWKDIKEVQKEIEQTGVKIQSSMMGHRSKESNKVFWEKADRLGLW